MFAQNHPVTLSPSDLVVEGYASQKPSAQTSIQVKTKKETMITSLPEVIRSHIYEFDGTYRQILAEKVFPEIRPHAWSQWENTYKKNITDKIVPQGLFGEYIQFTIRRDSEYFQTLIDFVKISYKNRIRCGLPDDLCLYLFHHDDEISIVENEDFCGRFRVIWKGTREYPNTINLNGFVVHRSEFEKNYTMCETSWPSLLDAPLNIRADGICTDHRKFRWHDTDFIYSVCFVQNDIFVIYETVEFEDDDE